MPKENIRDCAVPELRAVVSWHSDAGEGAGSVQIATIHTDSPARIPGRETSATPTGTLSGTAISGDPVGDSPETSPGDVQLWEPLDGWHVTLDRDGINRLIRVLRRARDAAYGTDA